MTWSSHPIPAVSVRLTHPRGGLPDILSLLIHWRRSNRLSRKAPPPPLSWARLHVRELCAAKHTSMLRPVGCVGRSAQPARHAYKFRPITSATKRTSDAQSESHNHGNRRFGCSLRTGFAYTVSRRSKIPWVVRWTQVAVWCSAKWDLTLRCMCQRSIGDDMMRADTMVTRVRSPPQLPPIVQIPRE